jgi:hypothetical protein
MSVSGPGDYFLGRVRETSLCLFSKRKFLASVDGGAIRAVLLVI